MRAHSQVFQHFKGQPLGPNLETWHRARHDPRTRRHTDVGCVVWHTGEHVQMTMTNLCTAKKCGEDGQKS